VYASGGYTTDLAGGRVQTVSGTLGLRVTW